MEKIITTNLNEMFKEGDTLTSFTIKGDDVPGIYTVEYIENDWITVYDEKNDVYRSYTFKGLLMEDESKIKSRVKMWKLDI